MVRRRRLAGRRAAVAVEMAITVPIVVLLFVIAMDFCRVFYYYSAVTNCARNGAVYASDPTSAPQSPYYTVTNGSYDYGKSVEKAAKADSAEFGSLFTVTATDPAAGGDGHTYSDITVTYQFHTIVSYVGVPSTVNLSRTIHTRVAKPYPNGLNL